MRTTIRMNDRILREAKITAAKEGISLTAFIERAVEEKLCDSSIGDADSTDFKLITFRGKGTCPGVDLDDSASLLDVIER